MFVKRLADCKEIVAGDETRLREILNPLHGDDLQIDYSLAHAIVGPGQSTRPHLLKTSSEVYYILQGEGIMTINGERKRVKSGDTVYIPPAAKQFINNTGKENLVFVCMVSPPWHSEDEVILDE
ncbi:MAG: cupin domain-containing protein [Candidatus Thorarchaeota archaeon]|nr:cupin domain-containing protein [Candidatus Thorarchaeota archaeon]